MSDSLGIDVGGTFTDIVIVDGDGRARAGKVISTPSDQGEGVANAITQFMVPGSDVARIVHGTTVVTNLLLERKGARVVLCATAGATDVLELRRQERAGLYDLSVQHPAPLVPPDDVIPVPERITPEGVRQPLERSTASQVADHVARLAPDVVAVSLLHAYDDPRHEQQLAAAIRARVVGADVVCSSEVLPEIREYERTATTCCEAYARPRVARYLSGLTGRLRALGMPAPSVVSSGGGLQAAEHAARAAASLALSGPAGGVAGAALVARLAGYTQALSIDIGGTSADVGLILGGEPLVEAGGLVAGIPIALPRVLVETVSAGGGSVGWVDDGGALRVGPRSAGAVPGPVAFGRGGTEATVTDAHIALGNIMARHFSGDVTLDVDGARRVVGALATRLGASLERTAEAMIATADAAMARALRRVSVERGVDPRQCVLVAFGGGGPLHACGLADALRMTTILIPPHAGVLSALGLAVAPARRSAMHSVMRQTSELSNDDLARRVNELADAAGRSTGPHLSPVARMRFRGQGHELEVAFEPTDSVEALVQRFLAQHRERYGFVLPAAPEVVSLRATVSADALAVTLARTGAPGWHPDASRDDGGPADVRLRGRHVVALPDATLLIADGWVGRTLPMGGWLLERES
ncbi:MAG: hydantoinase/oxoprolinase family protein [Gemmatimonadaceae bacterium]